MSYTVETAKPRNAASLAAALTSALVAAACLLLFVLALIGWRFFPGVLVGSAWLVTGIAAVAAVLRFCIRGGGARRSVACGVAIAVPGFFVLFFDIATRL